MAKKIFISYSHADGEWVWSKLQPVLKAGGTEVLIDRERFEAGKALIGQMDELQDQAELHIFVITENYLDRDYCRHEMERAVALDPKFEKGIVIPIRRDNFDSWPKEIAKPSPLYVDLRNDRKDEPWDLLMKSCGANLGSDVCEWLKCAKDTAQFLKREDSVNLVADSGTRWRELVEHLKETPLSRLCVIDLEDTDTYARQDLLEHILAKLGHKTSLPDKPKDLVEFGRKLREFGHTTIALTHFDFAAMPERQEEYGRDLFTAIRNLVSTHQVLTLLIVSHAPFGNLLPANHPLSEIDMKTRQLRP